MTVEQLWKGGSGAYETAAAVSGGWTRTDRTLPGGRVRHALTDGETTYIWYDSEKEVYAALGWLAREGKLVFQPSEDGKELLVSLAQDK